MPGDSATLPDSGSTESSDMPDLLSDSSSEEEFSDEDEDDGNIGQMPAGWADAMLGDTVTLPNGIIMTKEEYMHSWHIFDTGNSMSADASTTAAALDAMIDGGISFVGDSCK